MSAKRLNEIRGLLRQQNLDGLIVINRNHVRYLSGFYGHEDLDGLLMLSGDKALLLTDFRYIDEAKRTVKGAKAHIITGAKTMALKDFPVLTDKNLRFGTGPAGLHCSMHCRTEVAVGGCCTGDGRKCVIRLEG
jgi:Xaa-Pro aminopeptidase